MISKIKVSIFLQNNLSSKIEKSLPRNLFSSHKTIQFLMFFSKSVYKTDLETKFSKIWCSTASYWRNFMEIGSFSPSICDNSRDIQYICYPKTIMSFNQIHMLAVTGFQRRTWFNHCTNSLTSLTKLHAESDQNPWQVWPKSWQIWIIVDFIKILLIFLLICLFFSEINTFRQWTRIIFWHKWSLSL